MVLSKDLVGKEIIVLSLGSAVVEGRVLSVGRDEIELEVTVTKSSQMGKYTYKRIAQINTDLIYAIMYEKGA
jgi:translation initiation factor 2 gamma subunit (eIF-2gamma)